MGHGEKGSADIKSAEKWTSTTLPGLLEEYRPNEVRSIMQMKLGCVTEPLLMAHFAIVMKN